MRILNKNEAMIEKEFIQKEIRAGKIFIYPTDTIYGIGCNAMDEDAIRRIRELKERYHQPFSVIAPSKQWIMENCVFKKSWVEKLPGPYTLVMKLKNNFAVSNYTNPGMDTLGIRIPDHWFTELCTVPVVTTSVNKTGEQYMTTLEDVDADIKKEVDFIIYEGEKIGKPSTVVDLTKKKAGIKKR